MSICKGDEVCHCQRCRARRVVKRHKWVLTRFRGVRCLHCDVPHHDNIMNVQCTQGVTYERQTVPC